MSQEWCPIHHVEDDCLEVANQKAWENLKARFKANCSDQSLWSIDEDHRIILKKVPPYTGVQSTIETFWRNRDLGNEDE